MVDIPQVAPYLKRAIDVFALGEARPDGSGSSPPVELKTMMLHPTTFAPAMLSCWRAADDGAIPLSSVLPLGRSR